MGPFIFASRHVDAYPRGNRSLGPASDLADHTLGNDFHNPDGWNMYHGRVVPGFPAHPHRGFETITLVRQGFVDHADSTGAGARYGPGDVQWVTAGSGVSHSEMFPLLSQDAGNPFELYQIWLNLPASNKFADPQFSMQWREKIPVVVPDGTVGAAQVMVIAGRFDGVAPLAPPRASWAADPNSDVAVWLIDLGANSSMSLPATNTRDTERLLYVHGNGALLTVDGEPVASGQGYAQRGGGRLQLATTEQSAIVLVLQGVPLGEPVVQYGPFVMNSEEQLRQAVQDYRDTEFGGWPWPSEAPVYTRETPRFARFGDGRLEYPEQPSQEGATRLVQLNE
ncbi:pirin family protein [Mycobacteroides abscessus]